MNQEYAVIFEQDDRGLWGASVPDLPGCHSSGPSLELVTERIREAIEGHIETLRELGEPVPKSSHHVQMVRISA